MNGKLSAGSATEPKCFNGLFPSNIKTIALTAQSMPGDAPDKIDECIELLRNAGLNVKSCRMHVTTNREAAGRISWM